MNSPLSKLSLGFLGVFAMSIAPIRDAQACGGFFCNNQNPVDQSAERVVFALEDSGDITMHVQIFYQGESEDFAWIVPVPSNPKLFVSTDMLFQALDWPTNPSFYMERQVYGTFLDDVVGVQSRNFPGAQNIMWSSDYPHSETTWPNSIQSIEEHFAGVPEHEKHAMICGTAAKLYHLS